MITLTSGQLAALSARQIRINNFVHLSLPSEELRVCDAVGTLSADGYSWGGLGELGIIDGIVGDTAIRANQLSISIVGIPSSLLTPGIIADTRAVRYQGRPIDVSIGIMDPVTGLLIDGLIPVWAGFADTMTMQFGPTFSVVLTAERYDSILARANGYRATTYSHNLRLGNPVTPDLLFESQDRMMGIARPALQ